MKNLTLVLLLMLAPACAGNAPPTLSPTGVRLWQANEAVVIIGTAQHAAIELNKVQVCDPMPCHPLLSDHNTGIVVDAATDALTTLRAVPTGWKATTQAAIERIKTRLDAAGLTKFTPYLTAASAALALIG